MLIGLLHNSWLLKLVKQRNQTVNQQFLARDSTFAERAIRAIVRLSVRLSVTRADQRKTV